MSPTQLFFLAVAPGFAAFVTGAVSMIVAPLRGITTERPAWLILVGLGLTQLGAALWLVLVAPQSPWMKVMSSLPLFVIGIGALAGAWVRRGTLR